MSIGGRLGYDDDGQTPNTQIVYHDYDGPPLIFEVRGLPKSKKYQADPTQWLTNMDTIDGFGGERGVGLVVMCEGGKLIVIEGGETVVALDAAGKTIRRFDKDDPQFGRGWTKGEQLHFRNWLEAIRTRRPGQADGGDPRRPPLRRAVPHRHDLAPARAEIARPPDPGAGEGQRTSVGAV